MNKKIKYVGYVGEKNVGDEAIYTASKKLFSNYDLISFYQDQNSEVMLIGGGTMLPRAITQNKYRGHKISNVKRSYAVGVGVQHPSYYNKKNGRINVSHTLGRRNINIKNILSRLGLIGKGVILANTVIGDPINVRGTYITDSEYHQIKEFGFNYLGVRGPCTQSVLSEMAGQSSEIVGDTALYLQPDEYISKKTDRIAISIRGPGGNWSDYQNNLENLVSVCNSLADEYTFVLLPFYPPDDEIHQELHQRIQNSILKDYYSSTNIKELLNEISNTDLVIGEKLHASVLSGACHVPMISLQYKPKNRDFMSSINLEELNILPQEGSSSNLRERIEYALDNPEVVDTIQSSVSEYRNQLEKTAEKIVDDIEQNC